MSERPCHFSGIGSSDFVSMVIAWALIVSSPRLVRRTTPVTPMMSPMSIIGSRPRASSLVTSLWLKIWILPEASWMSMNMPELREE
ncbi:hypothetical protein D9M70_572640 [compost metagenome]